MPPAPGSDRVHQRELIHRADLLASAATAILHHVAQREPDQLRGRLVGGEVTARLEPLEEMISATGVASAGDSSDPPAADRGRGRSCIALVMRACTALAMRLRIDRISCTVMAIVRRTAT